MMVPQVGQLIVREANVQDTLRIANLIHFEAHVHRHLDWKPPLDWMGSHPYLVIERNGQIQAALICPPDPLEVAWIRLFAASSDLPVQQAWDELWLAARDHFLQAGLLLRVAAIPLQNWFTAVLEKSGFEGKNSVVVLVWRNERPIAVGESQDPRITIRPMNLDDMTAVEQVDQIAFDPLWRNSRESVETAFRQAAIATIVELDGKTAGYQISTATPMGGHLARLAVKPEFQGQKVGSYLLFDTLGQFVRRGAQQVTVNTQHDNLVSLALYQKAGFKRTGEEYPVYHFDIR